MTLARMSRLYICRIFLATFELIVISELALLTWQSHSFLQALSESYQFACLLPKFPMRLTEENAFALLHDLPGIVWYKFFRQHPSHFPVHIFYPLPRCGFRSEEHNIYLPVKCEQSQEHTRSQTRCPYNPHPNLFHGSSLLLIPSSCSVTSSVIHHFSWF